MVILLASRSKSESAILRTGVTSLQEAPKFNNANKLNSVVELPAGPQSRHVVSRSCPNWVSSMTVSAKKVGIHIPSLI
jgi:hypothetical protein